MSGIGENSQDFHLAIVWYVVRIAMVDSHKSQFHTGLVEKLSGGRPREQRRKNSIETDARSIELIGRHLILSGFQHPPEKYGLQGTIEPAQVNMLLILESGRSVSPTTDAINTLWPLAESLTSILMFEHQRMTEVEENPNCLAFSLHLKLPNRETRRIQERRMSSHEALPITIARM
jgi:hypothetical protein